MSNNHEEELKKCVDEKMNELSMAHYNGDIKVMVTIVINKDGNTEIYRGFDSNNIAKIYLACGVVMREIEGMIFGQSQMMKPRE